MKTIPTVSLLLTALLSAPALVFADTKVPEEGAADTFSPKEYSLSRYDHLNKKSPFEFDPQKPQEVAAVDPFEGVSLAGYVGSGNTMTVYILTGKEKKRVSVYGDGSPYKKRDESGFRVVGINRGKSLKTTTVTLEKDGQQKEIAFDEETLKPKPSGGQGGVQMVPGQDGKLVPRPVIPRPGGGNAPVMQQGGYQAPQPFIPGQTNTPAPAPGQPNVQMNFQPGNPSVLSANPGIPAQPGQAVQTQQQINQLLTNPPQPVAPQTQQGGNPADRIRNGVPPTRRRVVLPTQ